MNCLLQKKTKEKEKGKQLHLQGKAISAESYTFNEQVYAIPKLHDYPNDI